MGNGHNGTTRSRRGAAAVIEAAIMTPLLATVLLCTVGGAQMFRASMTTEAAAAEGARYAATHSAAGADEIASWTQASIGAGDALAVAVENDTTPGAQTYTMRVTDADGAEKSSPAKSTRTAVRVTATQTVHVLGLAEVTMSASHTGFRSAEGVAV